MKFDAKEMGKRIKNIRVKMGYTQEEFAEFLHISREQMIRLEMGKRIPSFMFMVEFAIAANVSLDYLAFGRNISNQVMKENIHAMIEALQKFDAML